MTELELVELVVFILGVAQIGNLYLMHKLSGHLLSNTRTLANHREVLLTIANVAERKARHEQERDMGIENRIIDTESTPGQVAPESSGRKRVRSRRV